jgi:predicted metal-dependent hydrolase
LDLLLQQTYNIAMRVKKPRPLVPLGEHQANLNNRVVNYQLKQSYRIRGIRLEIRHDTGLTVVVPRNYKHDQVHDILHKKADWILRHLPRRNAVQMPLFNKEVDHGEKICYMGKIVELIVTSNGHKSGPVELKDLKLYINLNGRKGSVAAVLEKWYRNQAELVFTQKADSYKDLMGLRYRRIVIRGQKTRWGSCSPSGTLSLNWKLLFAPEPVINYVIIHELAHLKHMDHSQRFWDFLARFCTDWEKHRKWLVTHEDELKTSASFGL